MLIFMAKKNVKWQSAFPFKKGDILNNRNIEQGLEQMLRIQSQDVQIKLVPIKFRRN